MKQALSGTSSRLDLIYSKEKFFNDFGTVLDAETELSDADFDVLLLYLSRDINAIAYDGKVVVTHESGPQRSFADAISDDQIPVCG